MSENTEQEILTALASDETASTTEEKKKAINLADLKYIKVYIRDKINSDFNGLKAEIEDEVESFENGADNRYYKKTDKVANASKINDLEITRDTDGILKIGNVVIPQKKVLFDNLIGLSLSSDDPTNVVLSSFNRETTDYEFVKTFEVQFRYNPNGTTNTPDVYESFKVKAVRTSNVGYGKNTFVSYSPLFPFSDADHFYIICTVTQNYSNNPGTFSLSFNMHSSNSALVKRARIVKIYEVME